MVAKTGDTQFSKAIFAPQRLEDRRDKFTALGSWGNVSYFLPLIFLPKRFPLDADPIRYWQ
jgi:hypothetical protein